MLAPDSLTETTIASMPASFSASRANASVSRPAVPLPTATARAPCFFTSFTRARAASSLRRSG